MNKINAHNGGLISAITTAGVRGGAVNTRAGVVTAGRAGSAPEDKTPEDGAGALGARTTGCGAET